MPRKSRIDVPGALHHIIDRGIERRRIFQTKADYADFLELMDMDLSELFHPSKERKRVQGSSLLWHWAVRELGVSMAELSRKFQLSAAAVSLSVERGEEFAKKNKFSLIE